MGTYASNSEVVFDTGRSVIELLSEDLEDSTAQQNVIRSARERAFNTINSKLRGKTAIPAFHIESLKQVEVDYVLSDLLVGAYTQEMLNKSEWAEKYKERADSLLQSLYFEASAEEPIAYIRNVGNGRLKVIQVFSDYAKEEVWSFTALNATEFSVVGSVSGTFPILTVDVDYPEKDWVDGSIMDYGLSLTRFPTIGKTPFWLKISSGSTPFAQYDNFKVRTYASQASRKGIQTGKLVRG